MLVLVDVIRVAFWIRLPIRIMRLVAGSPSVGNALLLLIVRHHLLEELGQAGNQPVAAADYVQATLVLMLFQDFVQASFQLIHSFHPHASSRVLAQLIQ